MNKRYEISIVLLLLFLSMAAWHQYSTSEVALQKEKAKTEDLRRLIDRLEEGNEQCKAHNDKLMEEYYKLHKKYLFLVNK